MKLSNQVVPSVQKGDLTKCGIERDLVVQNFNVLPKHESLASTPTIISYNAGCYTRIESFQTTIPSHIKKQYNLRWEKRNMQKILYQFESYKGRKSISIDVVYHVTQMLYLFIYDLYIISNLLFYWLGFLPCRVMGLDRK